MTWISRLRALIQGKSGQDLIEVVLDKVNVALSAPAAGVVRWHVQEGDLLQPGDVLATIEDA